MLSPGRDVSDAQRPRPFAGVRRPRMCRSQLAGNAGTPPALLPKPAAIGTNVASGKLVDHFGQPFRDSRRELTITAVEMRAVPFLTARGQPEHLRYVERGRQFQRARGSRHRLIEIGHARRLVIRRNNAENLHVAHAGPGARTFQRLLGPRHAPIPRSHRGRSAAQSRWSECRRSASHPAGLHRPKPPNRRCPA